MSSKNGDKARHHRMRKQKLARRLMVRELKQKLVAGSIPAPVVLKTEPEEA